MTIFLNVLGVILFIAGIVMEGILAYKTEEANISAKEEYERDVRYNKEAKKPVPGKSPKWPILVWIIGLVLFISGFSFKIVPTGYTGVRTTFGLIDQESCMPGFNGLIPFVQKISLVNNKQQDLRFEERVWSETSEQTVVYMENIQVTYQIVPESSAWIYSNVENWVENLVDTDLTSSALKSASRTLDASVVTDRGTIEPLAVKYLQEAVDEKYGENRVLIKNIVINNMDFEDSYNAAIAQKSQAIQEQQEQAIRNKTAIDKATAEAEAKRQAAQGDADAERIRAEGKAEANKILSDSITEKTQKQDIIEKWDGKLPKYSGTDGSMFGILEEGSETTE